MLAGREHSRTELAGKLARKASKIGRSNGRRGSDTAASVDVVLDELEEQGLLSDPRFVATVIRSRAARGYGPFYIQQELRSKGVDAELVEQSDAWQEHDWQEIAQSVVARRHPEAHADQQSWSKALRFLQRRGFSGDVVRKVLKDMPN